MKQNYFLSILYKVVTLLCLLSVNAFSQNKVDHIWFFDKNIVKWVNKDSSIVLFKRPVYDMGIAATNICDRQGKLKYYSNGCAVMGANHKVLPHGDTLSPGFIFNSYCRDAGYYPMRNVSVLLPHPTDSNFTYIFHLAMEDTIIQNPIEWSTYPGWRIYYSKMDNRLNNGIGDVVEKNVQVVQDVFLNFGLRATRHHNGKDWWIVAQNIYEPSFQVVLLTEKGVFLKGKSTFKGKPINIVNGKGNTNFSPDGKKYASADPYNGIFIYDFDACKGEFSNQVHIDVGYDIHSCGGVEFSPNSRFMYIALGYEMRQYDMWASDIEKSGVVVDTVNYNLPNASSLYSMTLSPYGKIYVGATHSVKSLGVIHNPDEKGKACNFKQQDFPVKDWTYVAMPNLPKYRGNYIDENCKGWIATKDLPNWEIKVFPNPATTQISIESENFNGKSSTFALFDIQGRQVFNQTLNNAKENIAFNLPNGIYFWRVFDENRQVGQGKLVVME
jgi:hypothetical protein